MASTLSDLPIELTKLVVDHVRTPVVQLNLRAGALRNSTTHGDGPDRQVVQVAPREQHKVLFVPHSQLNKALKALLSKGGATDGAANATAPPQMYRVELTKEIVPFSKLVTLQWISPSESFKVQLKNEQPELRDSLEVADTHEAPWGPAPPAQDILERIHLTELVLMGYFGVGDLRPRVPEHLYLAPPNMQVTHVVDLSEYQC